MKKDMRYTVWVSWVCDPRFKPYFGSLLSETKEKAESSFCDSSGKRSPMFADCKIVHQKVTIKMPPKVVAEFNKWKKENGGLS